MADRFTVMGSSSCMGGLPSRAVGRLGSIMQDDGHHWFVAVDLFERSTPTTNRCATHTVGNGGQDIQSLQGRLSHL